MTGRKRHQIHGLRRRWLISSVVPVLLLLFAGVLLLSAGFASYYYSAVRTGLESKAKTATEAFGSYGMKSYGEYYRMAASMAETFEDKDRVELQFIAGNGVVQVSSYGLTAGTSPGTSDVADAIESGEMAHFHGADPRTGETILSVSSPMLYNGRVVGVLRYVTSMRAVTRQLTVNVASAVAIAAGILAMVFIANIIFINSVVEPVAGVTAAAKRIAGGSYGVQVENRYRDELGELVDNINEMSMKISQTERMQQEFISSVSHELRTPLTAISGWSETLLGDPTGDAAQLKRGLGIIIRETRRLSGMVEELLDFSRMQDGRFTLHVDKVDLQAELEDSIYTYRELFRQEGIEVDYEFSDEPIEPVTADAERLKQVFSNVFDNAAKHGGSGGRIDASIAREDEHIVVRIRDHGPGIPPQELPFVKQKFYKGSSKARGSGIGLAVCDEIIRLHGGSFDIENADGGGTVVTIRIPTDE